MKNSRILFAISAVILLLTGCEPELPPAPSESESISISSEHVHEWSVPEYVWDEELQHCTASRYCLTDESHTEEETVASTYLEVRAPQCEIDGVGRYIATFEKEYFKTQRKDISLPAFGHDWDEPTYTWAEDMTTCTAQRVCKNDQNHVETEVADAICEVVTPATADQEGIMRFTAEFSNSVFATQTTDMNIPAGQRPEVNLFENKVTYGIFPQSRVTDTDLISALEVLSPVNEFGWYLYEDEYYTWVNAKPASNPCYYLDGTEVINGAKTWFKCDPIEWKILSSGSGRYFLLSEYALDVSVYYYDKDPRPTDTDYVIYANNYEHSYIRGFLNDEFYFSAFSLGAGYVVTTEVDNSAETTNTYTNPHAHGTTMDNVFLLSHQDYINPEYGFNSNKDTPDSARQVAPTDYAIARGSYNRDGYTSAWTRSPRHDPDYHASYVNTDGYLIGNYVYYPNGGIRPSINIEIYGI